MHEGYWGDGWSDRVQIVMHGRMYDSCHGLGGNVFWAGGSFGRGVGSE